MTKSKREDLGQIVIRPPAGMRDRIKAAAEANNRSMNAEIVATLEEKYPEPAPPDFETEMATMTEWLNFIDSSEDEAEFDRRLDAVNKKLQRSKANKSLRVSVATFPNGSRALYITKHGIPDFEKPMREGGTTRYLKWDE